jgi:hypothetical protein
MSAKSLLRKLKDLMLKAFFACLACIGWVVQSGHDKRGFILDATEAKLVFFLCLFTLISFVVYCFLEFNEDEKNKEQNDGRG